MITAYFTQILQKERTNMSSESQLRKAHPTKWLTVTAMLMAMNIVMSSFSIPVPGGHL